jgi:alpha-1,2-mannosyltransferase
MKTLLLRSPFPQAGQRWFALGLALFFVILSIPYGIKAWHGGSAFQRWQPQISDLGTVDIAERYNYPNPPVMALLLYPLARLPGAVETVGLSEKAATTLAALCWFYIKAALTLLAFRWIFQFVEEKSRPFPLWAKGLTILLALRPIMSDLQHGNVNLFILFLVVAALTAYHRQRDLLAGVMLGLAIACKVTPALFVPYLVWKRSWKALAGCAAGLVLFLWPGFVPALLMGWDRNERHLTSWYYDMVYPFVVEGKVTSEHHNQSLPGLVARLATHSPSFSGYIDNQYTPTHYDNLLDFSPDQARWFVKGCMGLFALLIVWVCRTPTMPRENWRLSAEFSMVLLGMLMFSERTWKHHCVTLVVPFAVICYHLATCSPGKGLRAYLIVSLAASMLLMATTSTTLQDGAGHHDRLYQLFAKQAQVYGAFVAAYFVLLAALVALLRHPSSRAPAAARLSRAA